MKIRLFKAFLVLTILSLFAMPVVSFAKEAIQDWELINPEGTIKLEPMEINPHPSSLEGKTVVLRANGKHNSDNFLNRVAELLQKEVKGIKIVKAWEVMPDTFSISQNPDTSKVYAQKIKSLKPDIVIGSQCD